jgi:hypothetical protein
VRLLLACLVKGGEKIKRLFLCCYKDDISNLIHHWKKPGRLPVIQTDSHMEHTITNCIQNNLSLQETHHLVNEDLIANGLPTVSRSTIDHYLQRMCPVIKSPTRLKQGSRDPLSAWSIARKNIVLQLLLHLGAM